MAGRMSEDSHHNLPPEDTPPRVEEVERVAVDHRRTRAITFMTAAESDGGPEYPRKPAVAAGCDPRIVPIWQRPHGHRWVRKRGQDAV